MTKNANNQVASDCPGKDEYGNLCSFHSEVGDTPIYLDANGNGPRFAGDNASCRLALSCDDASRQNNQDACPEVDATNFFYVADAMTFDDSNPNKILSASDAQGVSYRGRIPVSIREPNEVIRLSEDELSFEGNGYNEFEKNFTFFAIISEFTLIICSTSTRR